MIPLTWLLVSLIHCPEPKAVQPQKERLAKLLPIGRGQDHLIHHSQRTASRSVIQTSPPRKKQAKSHSGNKQHDSKGSSPRHRKCHTGSSPRKHHSHMLDSSSYPSDHRRASDSDLSPPRHKQSSGPRDSIPICHPHGIDLGTRALILTSPHQGGNSGPDLLILICLHLEGVSLWERRLHTCILGLNWVGVN